MFASKGHVHGGAAAAADADAALKQQWTDLQAALTKQEQDATAIGTPQAMQHAQAARSKLQQVQAALERARGKRMPPLPAIKRGAVTLVAPRLNRDLAPGCLEVVVRGVKIERKGRRAAPIAPIPAALLLMRLESTSTSATARLLRPQQQRLRRRRK